MRRSVVRSASFDEAASDVAGLSLEDWRQRSGLSDLQAKADPSQHAQDHARRPRHSHHAHRSRSATAESKSATSAEKKAGRRKQRIPSSMVELS